jgi:hypothetical protein
MFATVSRHPDRTVQPQERGTTTASTSLGIPNPVCIPHIGTRLVRNAPEEDDDDADTPQRGDEVDPFGQNVSKIVQQGSPWKTRHDRFEDLIVMLMQHSGMSAIGEPSNVVNGLIPRPLLRDYTQEDRVHRVFQGAVPDVAYTDPGHGKEMIVELKFINSGPTRYDRDVQQAYVPGQVRFITRPKSRTMRAKRNKRSRANRTNVPK